MRVLLVSSEVYPLIKTGGLADVAGALPQALVHCGVDARILLPAYRSVVAKAVDHGPSLWLGNVLGFGDTYLIPARMPDSGVPVWFVDNPALYDRDGGPYQRPDGWDHDDNFRRFALLSKVAAMIGSGEVIHGWAADVIHANDWQTGLVPAYVRLTTSGHRPRTVFTIHNLHFQGLFGRDILPEIGLPPESFSIFGLEFNGMVSFLKAGLYYADRLTTVSPTYAWEITTPEGGRGLDGLLAGRARAGHLRGILNGVDYQLWDPSCDHLIPASYDSTSFVQGKAQNKAVLQQRLGLDPRPDAPLLGLVSRFSDQKGVDLVASAIPAMVAAGAQVVLVGSGDAALERTVTSLPHRFPGSVGVDIGYNEPLAHLVQASSDLFLVPSRFEPCGLTQLYALRYGALPLVRRTGGLADTVHDIPNADAHHGTGFVFESPTVEGLQGAFFRALSVYNHPDAWQAAQRRAMEQDFGWQRAAEAYMSLFDDALAAP